jgi:hypothetical protein
MKQGGGDARHRGTGCRQWLISWGQAWNSFWFTASDPLPLAVLRIATGVLAAWASVVWLLDAESFFGEYGWQAPWNVWRMNDQPWQWSWYFAWRSPTALLLFGWITLLSAVFMTVGLATPLAVIVTWAGLTAAANRAALNVFGFDDVLGLLLVPLAIGPSGSRLSIDGRLFPDIRGAITRPSPRATVAIRLIQVHLCVLYFFSGCGKMLGASWWEGTALWGAVANVQYRTIDLTWLAGHPLLVNALTLGTLFWEVAYAALIWPRLTRPLFLTMAVAVHLGIGLAMGMMEFGLAMIVANLAFVPATALTWLAPFASPRSMPSRPVTKASS